MGLRMVDPIKAKTNASYCHAAIAYEGDLQVAHANGEHCDLKVVSRLPSSEVGMPVSAKYEKALKTVVLKLQNKVSIVVQSVVGLSMREMF